ncbi:hypothetical protein F5X97DRAFT_137411 [Nemania serpens]|nr:hypothetical protein F5X97DRAFT_137411 [Nemania serpens]
MARVIDIETSLERGVYLWCLIGLSSPLRKLISLPGGAATTVLVAAISSGCFIYGFSRGSLDADVRKRRRFVATGAAAYGLMLHAATRLLFRRWSPATIVGVSLGVSYASSLGLATLDSLNISSQPLYNMWQSFHGIQNKWNATLAQVRNRYIRIPLVFLNNGFRFLYMSPFVAFNALFDLRSRELPRLRLRVREWRRKLRMWASPLLRRRGPSYQYQSLSNYSLETPKIRLLRLRRRWPLGHIYCELITVDLHSDLQYDAISYHWGRSSFTEDIYIDGLTFKVAPIVQELLYHLSSYRRDRLLWIDAICINQINGAEKDVQIRLMRDVYRGAANVIVWLDGVQEPWMARRMLAGIHHEYIYGTTESCVEMLRKYSEVYAESGWMQLMNLFAHPWFCRTWVIQEVVMAQRTIVLASGEPLQFGHIATFAQMINSYPYGMVLQRSPLPGLQEEAISGLGNTALMASLAENRDNPRANLALLLGVFRNFRATEAVDRIYGLLGLLRAEEADQPHLWPDSSKTADKLYTDVARHLIAKNPQEILSFAGVGYPRKFNNLPSWAPDWTSVAMGDTYRQHFSTPQNATGFACGSALPTFVSFPDEDTAQRPIMRILGHVLDEIHHVGPEMGYTKHNAGLGGTDEEIAHIVRSHMCCRQLVLQHARQPYPTGQSLDEVFWRSLLADTQIERPAPAELGVGCRIWETSMSRVAGLDPGNAEDWDEVDEPLQRLSLEWNSARINAATGRTVGVTKEGYVSIVPPDTKVGDLVCVFYGVNTPFVIRPQVMDQDDGQRSLTRLVGEAYVHGMMDGEAFSIADAQPEWFGIV